MLQSRFSTFLLLVCVRRKDCEKPRAFYHCRSFIKFQIAPVTFPPMTLDTVHIEDQFEMNRHFCFAGDGGSDDNDDDY